MLLSHLRNSLRDRLPIKPTWISFGLHGPLSIPPTPVASTPTGPHTFYDIAPLKYNSWDEYEAGVKGLAANYKSAKFTVNDDAAIHAHGDLVWATATISEEMTNKSGKVEMGNFRWTAIWENQGGKWLIVHEHVSQPVQ